MRVFAALFVFALTVTWSAPLTAEAQDEQPRFRASVDVVTISAVVRDKQGRFVPALTKDDFTVLDNGQKRPILEFQPDENGPISVALLVDGSGSMRHFSAVCRRVGELLLTQLNDHSDDVALRSEEHTSELQSQSNLVCRLLLEKKNKCQKRHRD